MATNLTGTKRQSYTVSDKLRIINFAEQHGNRTAEWEFGVSENNVRLWRRTKENLEKMPRLKTDPFRTILFVCSLDFLFPFVYFFSGNHSPKIARVCIIHGRALYTGKYGKVAPVATTILQLVLECALQCCIASCKRNCPMYTPP